jgi:hypothetical protein
MRMMEVFPKERCKEGERSSIYEREESWGVFQGGVVICGHLQYKELFGGVIEPRV